jgi:hypothetical protein
MMVIVSKKLEYNFKKINVLTIILKSFQFTVIFFKSSTFIININLLKKYIL